MKSIVEEASSVLKAIEKGWTLAGKPQEFSIKVFEVEQKNFLGMSTKPAKIAIFFSEKTNEKSTHRSEANEKRTPLKKDVKPVRRQPEPLASPSKTTLRVPEERKDRDSQRELWPSEMSEAAQEWLTNTLRLMNLSHTTFSLETKSYYLKINFERPLFDDPERERILFRSFAYLLMQSLRNKFKKGLRGYKVILTTKAV